MSAAIRAVIKLIVGIAIFAGLPLVGWGISDAKGFIGHPARIGYIVLTVLIQVAAVIIMPGVGSGGGKGKKVVQRQRLALVLIQVINLAIVITAPYSDRRDVGVLREPEIVRYFGLVTFALGFIAMLWAEAFLGKQFSVQVTVQEGHKLVTGGPYRYLRHPRYLGIIVFNMGFSLVYRSWLALILVAALTVVLLWRIYDEEAFMRQEFGTDWEAYSKRSWRLIPFVY